MKRQTRGPREPEITDRLLEAESVEEALRILWSTSDLSVPPIVASLRRRAARMALLGRRAQASHARFLARTVMEQRADFDYRKTIERAGPQDRSTASATLNTLADSQDLSSAERTVTGLTRAIAEGRLSDALRQALAMDTELLDYPDHGIFALLCTELAGELRAEGRSEDALDVLGQADVPFPPLGAPDAAATAALLGRQRLLEGLLHEDLGAFELGRACYQAADEAAQRGGDAATAFRARTCLAISWTKSGFHERAELALRHVLERAERDGAPGQTMAGLNNLAAVEMGRDPQAALSHSRAVLRLAQVNGLNGPSVTTAWFRIGDLCALQGRGDIAAEHYATGCRIAERSSDEHRRTAVGELAERLESGDPEPETLLAHPYLFQLYQQQADAHDAFMAWAPLHGRARAARRRGDQEEAALILRQCREAAPRLGLDLANQRTVALELAEVLSGGGSAVGRQDAFDLLWEQRGEFVARSAASDRAAAVRLYRDVYGLLVALLIRHGGDLRLPDTRSATELAFDLHEEAKTVEALGELFRARMTAPAHVPEELRRAENNLLFQLRDAMPSHGDGLGQQELARRLAVVHARMKEHAPAYVALREGRPVTFAQLRAHLDTLADVDEMAFVSFLCGDAETAVFAYVPRSGRLTARLAPIGRGEITEAATALRRSFNGAPDEFPPVAPLHPRRPGRRDTAYLPGLTRISRALLLDLPSEVTDSPLLCTADDGPLHGLPLSALPDADGTPLVLRHAVVRVFSATMLCNAGARRRAVGVRRAGTVAEPGRPGRRHVLCAGTGAREDATPEQLESDRTMFGSEFWEVTELTGPAATRDAVFAALRGVRMAHVTCHGYFAATQPLDAGLLTADGGMRPSKRPSALSVRARHRQLLTARDITAVPLALDLMTLRACSAGVHDQASESSVAGLAQGLLLAGVGCVIAPLWDVDEESSRRLLARLYSDLADGCGSGDADGASRSEPFWRLLWKAQRSMLESPERPWDAHPFHWAALNLFGSWRLA